ncbi:hypothetical protein K466DRAFT_568757 [Polyporus arcularius HHB13444]|uniref:Homeobox domain-containing protein n=1 Tax=Polyporus arcularius HHB13444 TaxID=1314778 RepID=A0A5C3NWZ0_9APHY|nr:hypothetical protein K466DRAFT_568757 [Polyporus arcularius HHB13444]
MARPPKSTIRQRLDALVRRAHVHQTTASGSSEPSEDDITSEPPAKNHTHRKHTPRAASTEQSDVEPDGEDAADDAPAPKQRKMRGKGKGKRIEMLEEEHVAEGYTNKRRDKRIVWKKEHITFMESLYPPYRGLKGHATGAYAKKIANQMWHKFDWKQLMFDDLERKTDHWYRNRRQKEKREGGVTDVEAPEPQRKKVKDISPIFKKLRGRAPAASQLWAKANKDKVDEALGEGDIGKRQVIVADLFNALPEEEQEIWYDKVVAIEDARKNDPDAAFENQKSLSDALYTTLNEFPGFSWDKFGVVGMHLLYVYRDRLNTIKRGQLTAGSFKDHHSFVLTEDEKAPFDAWSDRNLPLNPAKRDGRLDYDENGQPHLPVWDDEWNRTQLCDVLRTFFEAMWRHAQGETSVSELNLDDLKTAPSAYLPSSWLDAGIENFERAKFGVLQALYERIHESHQQDDCFRFVVASEALETPTGAPPESASDTPPVTPRRATRTVVYRSPTKLRRMLTPDQSAQDGTDDEEAAGQADEGTVRAGTPAATVPAPASTPLWEDPFNSPADLGSTEGVQTVPHLELESPSIETLVPSGDDVATTTEDEPDELLPSDRLDVEQMELHEPQPVVSDSVDKRKRGVETSAPGVSARKRQRTDTATDNGSTRSTRITRAQAATSGSIASGVVTRAKASAAGHKRRTRGHQ